MKGYGKKQKSPKVFYNPRALCFIQSATKEWPSNITKSNPFKQNRTYKPDK